MNMPKTILTQQAPIPAGHYAQAMVGGGLVFISGQLPTPRADGSIAEFEEQVREAMTNLLAILAAAGSEPCALIKVTAYIVDVARWPEFNRIYASILGDVRVARTVVPVTELHHGFLVEIDAIALSRTSDDNAI
jgi:2-iminobutanoate/2-iminopropanoate deaminase